MTILFVDTVTDLINALPGNSSVSTRTQATITWKQFLHAVRTEQKRGVKRKYFARQRSCKHASTTMEDGVFRGIRAKELSQM
jgi:ABC-type Fe3+-citrate transport system substrate-binding protein